MRISDSLYVKSISGNTVTIDGSTQSNLFVIQDSGNIGIGGISPVSLLHIKAKDSSVNPVFHIESSDGSYNLIEVDGNGYVNAGQLNVGHGGVSLVNLRTSSWTSTIQSYYYNIALSNPQALGLNKDDLLIYDVGDVKVRNNLYVGDVVDSTSRLYVRGETTSSASYAVKLDDLLGNNLMNVRNDGFVGIGILSPTTPSSRFQVDQSSYEEVAKFRGFFASPFDAFTIDKNGNTINEQYSRVVAGLSLGSSVFSSNVVNSPDTWIWEIAGSEYQKIAGVSTFANTNCDFKFSDQFYSPILQLYNLNVGIGISASTARIHVQGLTSDLSSYTAIFQNSTSQQSLIIRNDGVVYNRGGGYDNSNTSFGLNSLRDNTTGTSNTSFGANALAQNISGNLNVAVGELAMLSNSTGDQNIAIGRAVLYDNIVGSNNVGIGYATLRFSTVSNLVAIGNQALYSNITGIENTAIGYQTLLSSTSSNYNTAIGFNSMVATTIGHTNTAIGSRTLFSNTIGHNNIALGVNALHENIDGYENVAISSSSLLLNTSGFRNIAIGWQSLYANTIGNYNIGIGARTLENNTVSGNIAIGEMSCYSNVIGTGLVGIGYQTLLNNTGDGNIAIGYISLSSNTSGSNNVAIGLQALRLNVTTSYNTAVGTYVLDKNIASYNTAVGYLSQRNGTTAEFNTSIGSQTLRDNDSGSYNIAIGHGTLQELTTTSQNTAIGYYVLGHSNGTGNVAIGYSSGFSATAGNNNIFIGSNSGYYETGSSKLFIDNATRTDESDGRLKALVYGIFASDPLNQYLNFNANVNIGTTYSVSQLKYIDGNQGSGKVLTSDANGNATWATASGGGSTASLAQVTAVGASASTDIEITDNTKGVILKSANNTRWRITIDNTGALVTTSL